MGCVAYYQEGSCQYVLGYVADGAETVVVLKKFQRRLACRGGQWLIVDVVEVPAEFSGRLESNDCRYGGAMMQPLVAAIRVAGEPGEWVGPAEWVVVVDWDEEKRRPAARRVLGRGFLIFAFIFTGEAPRALFESWTGRRAAFAFF